MNKVFSLLLVSILPLAALLSAAEAPSEDDIAQCVETTKIVFDHKDDRDPEILDEYYEPQFRALIKKGAAGEQGEAAFLDADFLRMTQDVFPEISEVGPGTFQDGRISVPVLLRFGPGESNTNTAVFQRVGDRWMICDLTNIDVGSLRENLEKEFGGKN